MNKKNMKPKSICRCDNPTCAKCLGVNCQDDNCPVHTNERKKAFSTKWEASRKKPFPEVNQEKS